MRCLHVNPSGREVRGVEAEIDGQAWLFSAHQVVLAAGAINTAEILLRSASDQHSRGLANGSDQVGRNLMKPQLTAILQLATAPNSGRYARSLGVSDYSWGDRNVSFPLGTIQSGGGVLQDALFAESPPVLSLITKLLPGFGLNRLASRSISWWAMSAVRPDPENRVILRGSSLQIQYPTTAKPTTASSTAGWTPCRRWRKTRPARWCRRRRSAPAARRLSRRWARCAAPAAWAPTPPARW